MFFLLSFRDPTFTNWVGTCYEEYDTPGAALHRAGYLINTGVAVHIEPMRRQ